MTALKFDKFMLEVLHLAMRKDSTSCSSCNRNEFDTCSKQIAEISSVKRLGSLYLSIVIFTSLSAMKCNRVVDCLRWSRPVNKCEELRIHFAPSRPRGRLAGGADARGQRLLLTRPLAQQGLEHACDGLPQARPGDLVLRSPLLHRRKERDEHAGLEVR